MKKISRWIVVALAAIMLLSGCASGNKPNNSGNLTIADNSVDFAKNLKLGWNLGNTLDATSATDLSSETSWGMPETTKEMMEFVKKSGFTSVRVPVSWGNHMDKDYNIDKAWMDRVETVVNYALDAGLYVILNSHHDNDYYYPSAENAANADKFMTAVWTQISERFRDYDERLVFEGMNEPRLAGTNIEWWFQSNDAKGVAAIKRIAELNQIFVDTVRAGDSYNKTRYLMVQSYAASPDFTMHNAYTIAKDPANRILISIHAYTPYDFAMNAQGYKNWDGSRVGELQFMQKAYNTFIKKGYGVVIGEFGCTNKGNNSDRIAWAKDYTGKAANFGISCILWDNGQVQIGEENFGMVNRNKLSIYFPELLKAYLSGYNK